MSSRSTAQAGHGERAEDAGAASASARRTPATCTACVQQRELRDYALLRELLALFHERYTR